jgi:hypothetical protein
MAPLATAAPPIWREKTNKRCRITILLNATTSFMA